MIHRRHRALAHAVADDGEETNRPPASHTDHARDPKASARLAMSTRAGQLEPSDPTARQPRRMPSPSVHVRFRSAPSRSQHGWRRAVSASMLSKMWAALHFSDSASQRWALLPVAAEVRTIVHSRWSEVRAGRVSRRRPPRTRTRALRRSMADLASSQCTIRIILHEMCLPQAVTLASDRPVGARLRPLRHRFDFQPAAANILRARSLCTCVGIGRYRASATYSRGGQRVGGATHLGLQ